MVKQEQQKDTLEKEEFFKVRLLTGESIRWLCTQTVKLHFNNTTENELDIEKEWKNLHNILTSSANERLGIIKRRNRRNFLKIWDDQIKQLIETNKKNHITNGRI
jgi:DNA-binding TFAR19-related protein (PDSD5 family)